MNNSGNDAGVYIADPPLWWNSKTNPQQVAKVVAYLETLLGVEAYKAKPINGLLLYGPPGTGKTSAAVSLLYAWGKAFPAREHPTSRFQDFGELMVRIRSAWRRDAKQTVEEIHAQMFGPRILVLDDIGKRADAEDASTLSTLINGRINRGRPTIVTTNCDLTKESGIAEFKTACDSRVLERFSRCDVEVTGTNLRRI